MGIFTLDNLERKFVSWRAKLLCPIYKRYVLPRKAKDLRKKKIIKVLFVLHELGSWKTENLYLHMREHPRFDAQLLLLPSLQDSFAYEIVKNILMRSIIHIMR